ncbi:MAG: hypothetical protein HWN67_03630 [Candidatus Helarchaeota archaeon]|nr:hypothetical protein [Candidatus Helarchaeota archaeon]
MKERKNKILFVSRDSGGTNAVTPVIKKLISSSDFNVKVFASGSAEKIFANKNIPFISLNNYNVNEFKIEDAEKIIKSENPSIVITGTSLNDNSENYFRWVAKKFGIPTVSILDQWMNYMQRFQCIKENLECIPDIICVMDRVAKDDMIKEGFKSDRIEITGNPYFDDIFSLKENFNEEKVSKFRRLLNVNRDEFLITFASEPIENSEEENHEIRNEWGYTEKTVISYLLTALENISFRKNLKICLIIKLHPREIKSNFDKIKRGFSSKNVRIIINHNADPRKLILSSDLIAGMTSIFLIESVLLEKLTISLQPESKKPDFLITNRVSASIGVYKREDIEPLVEKMIFDKEFQEDTLKRGKLFNVKGSATDNILKKIYEII